MVTFKRAMALVVDASAMINAVWITNSQGNVVANCFLRNGRREHHNRIDRTQSARINPMSNKAKAQHISPILPRLPLQV